MGDRVAMVLRAIRLLDGVMGHPCRRSRLFETEPRLDLDQPPFVNAVVQARWSGGSAELLAELQTLETTLGRSRQIARPKGPRCIDLDLLLFGTSVIDTSDLVVPHPGIASRRFVLQPLAELASSLAHPQLGLSIGTLLAQCPDQGWVHEIDPRTQDMERTVA